ncbi:MAG: hypothetical protein ACR2GY_02870 [Phycisphaerales bacterium]
MMNRKNTTRIFIPVAGLASLAMFSSLMLSGCSEPPPPPPVVRTAPPPPPPPPPPPRVDTLDDLRAELNTDPRIVFDELDAPRDTAQRRAILTFFDAFARGNSTAARQMMPPTEKHELDDLIQSGRWDSTIQNIEEILISTGDAPAIIGVDAGSTNLAVLAIFQVDGDYQPTLWYLSSGADGPEFIAAPTPPDILNRVSGTDMIAAWHAVIEVELARANDPDIEEASPQQILAQRAANEGGPINPDAPPEGPMPPSPGGAPPGGQPGPGPSIPIQ